MLQGSLFDLIVRPSQRWGPSSLRETPWGQHPRLGSLQLNLIYPNIKKRKEPAGLGGSAGAERKEKPRKTTVELNSC